MAEKSIHEKVAEAESRDSSGKFAKKPPQPDPSVINREPSTTNPISQFLSSHAHYSKSQDDLLDIHVGNPLRRITQLLEDLKKQKAFSFTLKGSLGIMGVFLALSVFGILGGGKILCDKGEQTQIGTIKTLQIKEKVNSQIPLIGSLLDSLFIIHNLPPVNRTVLVKKDEAVIRLVFSNSSAPPVYPEQSRRVLVTGNYDSCSQTLTVKDQKSLEYYR